MGSLFGPKAPKEPPRVPRTDPDDPALKAAERRRIAMQQTMSGRGSVQLGEEYQRGQLGGSR